MLGCLGLLLIVAVAANYDPIRHYQEARARVDEVAAEVATLEAQKAELQAQLGKLSESGYLEELAREKLAYARPGEDLYIVVEQAGAEDVSDNDGTNVESSGAPGADDVAPTVETSDAKGGITDTGGFGVGGVVPSVDKLNGYGVGVMAPAVENAGAKGSTQAGFLERIVSAIAGIF